MKIFLKDELAKIGAFVGALQKECDEKQAKLEKLGVSKEIILKK